MHWSDGTVFLMYAADFKVWPIVKIGGNTVEQFEDVNHKNAVLYLLELLSMSIFYIPKNSFGKITFLRFWLNYD